MKLFPALSASLFLLSIVAQIGSAEESRTWKRKDGKVAEGTILEKSDETIKMRLPNLRVVEVKISELSLGDQAYIKAWSPPPPPKPEKAPEEAVYRDGMWFAVIRARVTWHEARKLARRMGGMLATAEKEEDHAFFASLTKERDYLWLGGYDPDEDGVWEWVDGRPLQTENWDTAEPSNRKENRHYILMRASGKWDDTVADSRYATGYIVQWADSET